MKIYFSRLGWIMLFGIIISSCAYNYQEKEVGPIDTSPCDTTKSYVYADVSSIFTAKCNGCHNGGSPDISDFASYKNYINSNRSKFEAAIQFTGAHPMPKGGPKLPDADICKILTWIKQGIKP